MKTFIYDWVHQSLSPWAWGHYFFIPGNEVHWYPVLFKPESCNITPSPVWLVYQHPHTVPIHHSSHTFSGQYYHCHLLKVTTVDFSKINFFYQLSIFAAWFLMPILKSRLSNQISTVVFAHVWWSHQYLPWSLWSLQSLNLLWKFGQGKMSLFPLNLIFLL